VSGQCIYTGSKVFRRLRWKIRVVLPSDRRRTTGSKFLLALLRSHFAATLTMMVFRVNHRSRGLVSCVC
jgi:hypothetical protein